MRTFRSTASGGYSVAHGQVAEIEVRTRRGLGDPAVRLEKLADPDRERASASAAGSVHVDEERDSG